MAPRPPSARSATPRRCSADGRRSAPSCGRPVSRSSSWSFRPPRSACRAINELGKARTLPPSPIDVRTAAEIDEHNYESAQHLARQGAELARELGLEADPLVVAEDPETPIAETIVSLAKERDAQAVVVGPHRHGPVLLGSVSRDVVRHAPCPVVVASRNGA